MKAPSPRVGCRERLWRGQPSGGQSAQMDRCGSDGGGGDRDPRPPLRKSTFVLQGTRSSGKTGQGFRVAPVQGSLASFAGRVPSRPALLRTCSAASGSRCGSSSGTVNWIFRGLLSCSMAWGGGRGARAAAGGGKAAGLGAGAGARPSPLRSGPGPSPARSAPGSRLPAQRSRLPAPGTGWPPIGSAPAAPGPLPPPPARSLNPVVAAPASCRGSPPPRAGARAPGVAGPCGHPAALGVLARE